MHATRVAGLSIIAFAVAGVVWFALEGTPASQGFDGDNPADMVRFVRAQPEVFARAGVALIVTAVTLVIGALAVAERSGTSGSTRAQIGDGIRTVRRRVLHSSRGAADRVVRSAAPSTVYGRNGASGLPGGPDGRHPGCGGRRDPHAVSVGSRSVDDRPAFAGSAAGAGDPRHRPRLPTSWASRASRRAARCRHPVGPGDRVDRRRDGLESIPRCRPASPQLRLGMGGQEAR